MTATLAAPPTVDYLSPRITKFEVKTVDGDWKDANKRWFELMDQVKQITNYIYQQWLVWHVLNDSASKIRAWLEAREQCSGKAGVSMKDVGKCPVNAVPKELQQKLFNGMKDWFPNVHVRVTNLIVKATLDTLKRRKAAKGKLPGHTAILLCHESIPTSRRQIPIRFDRQNAVIEPPAEPRGNFHVRLRLWRLPRDGKMALSVEDRLELRCQGKSVQSQVAILKRIEKGIYKFCGSNLVWDDGKRKWFVHLTYQMPKEDRTDLDPDRVATLTPSRRHPFSLRIPGVKRRDWLVGAGRFVGRQRERVFLQRRSRSEYHKHANTNRKGHGRIRAQNWRWKLQRAWLNFVKRTNHIASTRAVERCVAEGCGTLVYYQPMVQGGVSENRFLSREGKTKDWNDATTWEFFQIKTFLEYKCQRAGIALVVKKI